MTPDDPSPAHPPSPDLVLPDIDSPLPTAAIPPDSFADDSERKLDPNYIRADRLIGWIIAIIVTVGVIAGNTLVFWLNKELHWALGLVVLGSVVLIGGLCWLAHCWPTIEYRHRSYRVNDRRIEIRKGVLWRTVLDVPRSRVQHTDVNQGPIERKYGLAHLVIHTAGTTSASVTVEGLSHETAVRIRDHLVATGGDDAV